MLMYSSSSRSMVACSEVNSAVPSIGESRPDISPMLTCTPALVPLSAGPWKWAMLGGPVKLENSMLQDNSLFEGSNSKVAEPLPSVSTEGTSWEPSSDAMQNVVVVACAVTKLAVEKTAATRRIIVGIKSRLSFIDRKACPNFISIMHIRISVTRS